LQGSLDSAKSYFQGASSPIQASCQKNFVVLATDGMPTGKTPDMTNDNMWPMWPLSDQVNTYNAVSGTWTFSTAVNGVLDSVRALRSTSFGGNSYDINTYVIALGDSVANAAAVAAMNEMANQGGTSSAFFANNQTALNNAFAAVAQDITSRTGAASAVTLNTGTWNAGSYVYQAKFNAGDWSGQLLAYAVGSGGVLASTPTWDAGQAINSQNWDTGRNVLTYKPSATLGSRGIPFRWPANPASPTATELDSAQSTWLSTNMSGSTDANGNLRLNYIRGDGSQECLACTPKFRPRPTSKLGDIASSSPVYVGAPAFYYPPTLESVDYASYYSAQSNRTPVLYVGANDGMLHAFSATTGSELFSYIPTPVYRNFGAFTDPAYTHRYFVDGTPTVGDVFYGGAWHTVLVGGLRGGGQGIYALDVTNPSSFSEANAASIVRWEYTDADDADLGYTYGQPIIVKVRTGSSTTKWAAIFGNGYNNSDSTVGAASTTGYAVLYVVDIETGALISKISTKAGSTATPNGLATPVAVDVDGDYVIDFVYAGDLQGNLWKFDLTATNPSTWKSAFMSGSTPQPLFSTGSANKPIMVRPDVAVHPQGGYLITFGTGSYIASGDNTTTAVQTIYGIWDKNTGSSSDRVAATDLVQQSIINTQAGSDGNTYRITSHAVGTPTDATYSVDNAITTTNYYSTKRGWYMDLPQYGTGSVAERVVSDPAIRSGRSIFATVIPNTTLCSYGGDGWIQEFDIYTGNRITTGVFDTNGDNVINALDMLSGAHASGRRISGIPMAPGFLRDAMLPGQKPTETKFVNTSAGTVSSVKETGGNVRQGRTSWLELFQ
jgi:type IV pilus assembly protein PilY1